MVPVAFLFCDCGYDFSQAPKRPAITRQSVGFGWVALVCGVLLFASIVVNQYAPYFREPRAVTIVVVDENKQPVCHAVVAYQEFEVVPIITLVPFGPFSTILKDHTVTTDDNGKAAFTIRFATNVARSVSLAGTPLKVVYSETTDSYDNQTRRSYLGQLPQWDVGEGSEGRHWHSTIVVHQ